MAKSPLRDKFKAVNQLGVVWNDSKFQHALDNPISARPYVVKLAKQFGYIKLRIGELAQPRHNRRGENKLVPLQVRINQLLDMGITFKPKTREIFNEVGVVFPGDKALEGSIIPAWVVKDALQLVTGVLDSLKKFVAFIDEKLCIVQEIEERLLKEFKAETSFYAYQLACRLADEFPGWAWISVMTRFILFERAKKTILMARYKGYNLVVNNVEIMNALDLNRQFIWPDVLRQLADAIKNCDGKRQQMGGHLGFDQIFKIPDIESALAVLSL